MPKRLTFENRHGMQLAGQLDFPGVEAPQAYALFAHCFTCNKNLKAVVHISRALNQAGVAVLRFDFTGLGESDGDFADTNFTSDVDDLVDAARFLDQQFGPATHLIGHSLGGAAVLQAASQLPTVQAVCTIGAPSDPKHVLHLLVDAQEDILTRGEAMISLAGRQFKIKKQFLDDLKTTRQAQIIQNLKRALLVLHAPLDNIVSIDNANQIFQAAKHPKSFISLNQADHLLSRTQDSLYVGAVIAAWAQPYIGLPTPKANSRPNNLRDEPSPL